MNRKESIRLFWKILKENLTDTEAIGSVREFFDEIKKVSRFLFWLGIIIIGGYIGIFAYNLLTQASQLQMIFMALLWGGFGFAILQAYSMVDGKKRRRGVRKDGTA